jgi:hypothetical protein
MGTPANNLTNSIIGHIYFQGGYAWRAESTGIMDKAKGVMRTAPKKGVADILGCYKGFLVAIEVKIGKDRLSDEQEGFLKNIQQHGGYACVAKDMETFKEWWKEMVSTVDGRLHSGT